ncbi:hypothetical protein [Helicobacter heilmannii]|uniref:hypothetical protein n=1 Tax=Helicobacter heilmannii TaxID=35817 RepID=UPI0006A1FCBD|nr:hypothetical protein [Helicobacter heilmannii]CRF45656.1 hypothetical protein HHE014_06270 [Helicobacter heilmannii]
MSYGISTKEVPLSELKIFTTNHAKHATLLELVSVALADSRCRQRKGHHLFLRQRDGRVHP